MKKHDISMETLHELEALADRHIPELMGTIWSKTTGHLSGVHAVGKTFDLLFEGSRDAEFLQLLRVFYTLVGLPFPKSIADAWTPRKRSYLMACVLEKIEDAILDFQGVEY